MDCYQRVASERDIVFFFSSRRRHTRLQGDWSSDVCSSDLRPQQKRSINVFLNRGEPMKSGRDNRSLGGLKGFVARTSAALNAKALGFLTQIGRASCRERV